AGAYFHIIVYQDISDLGYLVMSSFLKNISEPVSAYDRIRMNNHPVADNGIFPDSHIRVNCTPFTDAASFTYKYSRKDYGPWADSYLARNIGEIINSDIRCYLSLSRNERIFADPS